jgi:hypothetical protein
MGEKMKFEFWRLGVQPWGRHVLANQNVAPQSMRFEKK